jgi:cytosine/adenosine deaminase-related metal-dependent hydrolase
VFWSTPLTFVNARVVGPDGRLGRSIRIKGDRIDAIDVAPARGDAVVDLGDSFVFPGLINAHEHLELNSQPRLKWRDRYNNASEWFADFQPRFDTDPALAVTRPDTLEDRVWVGGLKNLLSGVTTVCHHNPMHRILRGRFPVRVVNEFGYSHSLHIDGDAVMASHRKTPADWPWMIHAAEGCDQDAERELDTLDRLGCLTPNTVLIHGVAFGKTAADRVINAGAGLVWCPSSNEFLFKRTADVRAFDDADRLGLGSDSRLSGEGDLLDELKVAHATRQLSAEGLARTVTSGAARLLRLRSAGCMVAAAKADITIIRPLAACPYDSLVSASRSDIRMTMINGKPCVGDPALAAAFEATSVTTMPATVDGADRLIAGWIGRRVLQMQLQEKGLEVRH